MATVLDVLSWITLMGGCFFILTGSIGLLRMPDFFTRLHPAGVTDTMGVGLILLGLFFQAGMSQPSIKLFLILLILMFTGPTASHALAKAALHGNVKPRLDNAAQEESSSNT